MSTPHLTAPDTFAALAPLAQRALRQVWGEQLPQPNKRTPRALAQFRALLTNAAVERGWKLADVASWIETNEARVFAPVTTLAAEIENYRAEEPMLFNTSK